MIFLKLLAILNIVVSHPASLLFTDFPDYNIVHFENSDNGEAGKQITEKRSANLHKSQKNMAKIRVFNMQNVLI